MIHPETHKIEDTGIMNEPMTYKMMLNEVPDALHTVEVKFYSIMMTMIVSTLLLSNVSLIR